MLVDEILLLGPEEVSAVTSRGRSRTLEQIKSVEIPAGASLYNDADFADLEDQGYVTKGDIEKEGTTAFRPFPCGELIPSEELLHISSSSRHERSFGLVEIA